MKAIVTAVLVVSGAALFVWQVAHPIADAIEMAHFHQMHLRMEVDSDSPEVAAATGEARQELVATLESAGIHVRADSGNASADDWPEILVTVHGYARCGTGNSGRGDLLVNVEMRFYDRLAPAGSGAPGSPPPRWWRATPLERSPSGAAHEVRRQILDLGSDFITDHHLPTRPAQPLNPRHIGWS